MNTRQKSYWWIDASLFTGLIFSFYLDLTGVEVHQWLGVFGAALAIYHLVTHWSWVTAVSRRFFKGTSGKARLNYTIDALILAGFAAIAVTGLVISTWFDLTLTDYAAWLQVHITLSIITLVVTVLKLALHWRWIVSATRSIFTPQPLPQSRIATVRVPAGATNMSRAEFLKVMSVVGAFSFLAMTSAGTSLKLLQGTDTTSAADDEDASSTSTSAGESTSSSSTVAVSGSDLSSSSTASSASVPSSSLTVEDSSVASSVTSSTCTVRCNHSCAYPGQCRKYTDSNNNGYCDLGECA